MNEQFCFLCVLAVVPPHDVNVTTEAFTFVDNLLSATCCASGYPEPAISINGVAMPMVYGNYANGIYRGCTSRNVSTSGATAGTTLTTYCNVSITQSVNCTTRGSSGQRVHQQAVSNCKAALTTRVLVSSTTLIASK